MSLVTNYPMRAVAASEIVPLFGSAETALQYTGGDEPTALFYIYNPGEVAKAIQRDPTTLRRQGPLLADLKELAQQERQKIREQKKRDAKAAEKASKEAALVKRLEEAARAWIDSGTLKAVRYQCRCGQGKARELIDEAKRRGMIKVVSP